MTDDSRESRAASRPSLDDFLDEPPRDLDAWRWLWRRDEAFPIRSHRGWLGKLLVAAKKLLRPLVRAPQNDLWERQRVFNLVLMDILEIRLAELRSDLESRVDRVQELATEGLQEVMAHDDALYSRLDQKLERYRKETREHASRLSAALAAVEESESVEPLVEARRDRDYLSFEGRYRGTEEEIRERLRRHLPTLKDQGPVLDLGCGRGELLSLLRDEGVEALGVDGNREMVERCRERELEAEQGDLFDLLARREPGSVGAVVSIHVIEHLPPEGVERLVRLAHGALRPGGVLLLETPNPRSVVVGASRFWIDPTHRRPVHPDTLRWMAGAAGFERVEIRDLHPFPREERLPELGLEEIPPELHELVDRLDRQRDRLEDLLHGYQDYALVARR